MEKRLLLETIRKVLLNEATKTVYGVRDVYVCDGREAKQKLIHPGFKKEHFKDDDKVYFWSVGEGLNYADDPSKNKDLEKLCKGVFDEMWKVDFYNKHGICWLLLNFYDEFQLNICLETANPDNFYDGWEKKKYVASMAWVDNAGDTHANDAWGKMHSFTEFFNGVKKAFAKLMR